MRNNNFRVRVLAGMAVTALAVAAAGRQKAIAADPVVAATQSSSPDQSGPNQDQNQNAPNQAQNASDQGRANVLSDIVVTATRQAEVLSRVPASVQAVTGTTMEQNADYNLADLVGQMPSVRIDPENNNVSIRGIASTSGQATAGIYIDDTPIQLFNFGAGASSPLPYLFDFERVELLRGPQGTLFGAGAEGGAIRFITPAPSLDRWSVYSQVETSFTQDSDAPNYVTGVAVGGPIVNGVLGFHADIVDIHQSGWINDIDYNTTEPISQVDKGANWQNTIAGRLAFGYQPIANLTITPGILYQNIYNNDNNTFWEYYSNPSEGNFDTSLNPSPISDWYSLPSLKIDYEMGNLSLISNTSYFYRNQSSYSDGTQYDLGEVDPEETATSPVHTPVLLASGPNGPLLQSLGISNYENLDANINEDRGWTQETRLQTNNPNSRFNFVAGFFYSNLNQYNDEVFIDPQWLLLNQVVLGHSPAQVFGFGANYHYVNGVIGERLNTPETVDSDQAAGFLDASWEVIHNLKAEAGVRVADTRYDFTAKTQNPAGVTPSAGGTKENPVTPKYTLSYQVTPDDMVYGTVSKGYRIGGANRIVPQPLCTAQLEALHLTSAPLTYGSDSVWNYEVGAKGRFEDAVIDGSVYRLEWNDIQTANNLTCGVGYTTNGGKARSEGFDLHAALRLSSLFSLDATVAYTDALFTTTTHSASALGPVVIATGDAVNGVAPWTVSVAAISNFNVANHSAYVRITDDWASKQWDTSIQDPLTTQYDPNIPVLPSNNMVKGRLGMLFDSDAWDVSLFCNNCFNAHPLLYRSHIDLVSPLYTDTTFQPRTVGVTATFQL